MQKLSKIKFIVVGLTLLSFGAALFMPIGQAVAQTAGMADPGPTPPLDADPYGCISLYFEELAQPQGTAPGPLIVKDMAAINNRLQECILRRGEKNREWWYRRATYLKNQWGMRFITSIYGGLIDAMAMISQRVAYEAANDILTGNPGGEPRFWNSDFSTWLENAGLDASSKFIDRLDVVVGDWSQSTTATVDPKTGRLIPGPRFSFCKPPDPYSLKLSLGIGEFGRIGPGACNLKKVAENFKAIGDMVESGDALKLHRPSVQYGASDLSVGVETNSAYFNYMLNQRAGLALNRQEDHGLRPVMDIVSGKIQVPTVLAENSYQALDPIAMGKASEAEQRGAILNAYFQVGLENIPMLALQTFSNTLIVGLLHKWLDPKSSNGLDNTPTPQQIIITAETLKNADATGEAQDLYERQEFAKALGDYLIPNFASTEDRDMINELTNCNTPRSRFNCAMDQALGVAIQVGTVEGAFTVGRASGVGSRGAKFSPSSQALHADWELIPENDLKNNTDPTCAQRAYCAGNLKKMRLARIIPVGWEMAANSLYNVKHNGKYVTLGEVINGFYDCNSEGKIDKEHPWCHLIDPNWILTAPKYQCRAKGFGDAVLPQVGTRLEECGEVVSCLKSNQNNECVGGYGYCLAERPVWKFDTKTCDEQFVSCRTYNNSAGQISLLRYTEDKGKCSSENIGCQWFATQRYATSSQSADGLWVGTVTSGPRIYVDKGAQPCSAEGCTKVLRVAQGQSALNLIQNGSFEQTETKDNNGTKAITAFTGWTPLHASADCLPFADLTGTLSDSALDGAQAIDMSWPTGCSGPQVLYQDVNIQPGRNYVLSMNVKSPLSAVNGTRLDFEILQANGSYSKSTEFVSTYGDCSWETASSILIFGKNSSPEWSRQVCQFVSPTKVSRLRLGLLVNQNSQDVVSFDAIQLEEGEVLTPFVDGVAQGLAETYLKLAPNEYNCTGDDKIDHPGCKRFARVCRQIDVGCQGYQDVSDTTAPEVPAILSSQDLCPAMCAGYGEYRKLASTFDLVKDPAHPAFDDPEDETTAYFIPSLSEKCTLEDVGCESFTSMEAATSTGERVAYYKDIRLCEKPNNYSATYYTWEGSETTGYQLKTWSLIADTNDPSKVTSSPPKLVLRGGILGYIKDASTCNDVSWKLGNDPDCRQFYDVGGQVYYAYYSQTVSSDAACTTYRKDELTKSDCLKSGGKNFDDASKSCTYMALPAESLVCSQVAGSCRAYLGPTGRNAVNVYRDTFATGTQIAFDKQQSSQTTLQYSNESVLVGDRSLKLQAPYNASIDATLKLAISSTSSLMRISFWAKANTPKIPGSQPSRILVDGTEVGSFYPDINWARFEAGPFMATANPTLVEIVVPSKAGATADNIVYIDTFSVDQLNDVQFVRKNYWAIPAACDATPEGVPESRYMVGCREYQDRIGNQVFVRNFNRLCRDTAIGCSAFVDTNDKGEAYSSTKKIKGTAFPQDWNAATYPKHGAAKMYEEQFFGDWSVTSRAYRYIYAIDDERGRCDSSEASCRAYGKPVFRQDRIQLATTTYQISPKDVSVYKEQSNVFKYETVLLKDGWDSLLKENGDPDLACRKDELFCDQFQSGNITEFFRDPGQQTCVWRTGKKLKKNDVYGIPSDGDYSGWFRDGTDIPCYGSYLSSGNTYLLQYAGETGYAGWSGKCPVDQSECTEFIDPNDTSDATKPNGRSYYIINGPKVDKASCGGTADPLSGCVLFQDKGLGTLEANSQATYAKSMAEKGSPQTPVDCAKDPGNQYCATLLKDGKIGICVSNDSNVNGSACKNDQDCASGSCKINDSNVVLKVKMDRECARWMGCRSGETVFDSTQQKFVTQCTNWQLCQQNGTSNEDVFCKEFSDRSLEDFLTPGKFVTPESYSARSIGFGKLDYSGYTMANRYLLPDMETDALGFDLLKDVKQEIAKKYELNNNLVAYIPKSLTENLGNDRCQDPQTNRIGLLKGEYCLLPIGEVSQFLQSDSKTTFDTSFDADQIAKELARGLNFSNANFQQVLPMPECQLYPEEDSPLSTLYVLEWNINANPPTPKKMIEGFEQAKTCVYGEDCSCSYRKVRYNGGKELYYAIDGTPPMIGICRGGERDGQPCTDRAFTPVVQGGKLLYSKSVLGDYNPCGVTGICEEIQDVVFVKGKYAYCLERDLTRASSAPQKIAPCLTWAPIALQGKLDSYHYAPTADYMPMQGRGEYYCVSGTQGQSVQSYNHTTNKIDPVLNVNFGESFYAPGKTKNMACDYRYVMNQPDQDLEMTYLNGGKNSGYTPAQDNNFDTAQANDIHHACRRAELCLGKASSASASAVCDAYEGLWIQAGPKHETTYSEYFVAYKPGLEKAQDEKFYDYNYGMFRFFPVKAMDGAVCKWHPAWVGDSLPAITNKDFSCSSYLSEVQAKSDSVYQRILDGFNGILDRRNESILKDSSLTPLRLRCVLGDGEDNGCYYKYWQIDYNTKSNDKLFDYPKDHYENQAVKGQDISKDLNFFSPSTVNAQRCESDHPYFGIRAMFQNVNDMENSMSSDLVQGRKLQGPWQFVGFWITACAPYQFIESKGSFTSSDDFLMYLKLQAVTVDSCRTVAQVIEPNTRESAAFADRVWASGKFIVPYIGAKYSRFNEPFGSAIASTRIGADPMVIGDTIPPSSDPSATPTFPDAGLGLAADFVGTDMDPWFSLTNLFARVYSVWRWDVNQIYINTPVCTDYPDKAGTESETRPTCTTVKDGLASKDQILQNIKDCSGWSDVTPIKDQKDLDTLWACNSLSGVNRGLACGQDPKIASKNSDPACHNAAKMFWKFEEKSGLSYTLDQPLYGSCKRKYNGTEIALRIPRLSLSEQGKGFKLRQVAQGACNKLGESDRVLALDGPAAKSMSDIAGPGMSMPASNGIYGFYKDHLLSPANLEELVYKIVSQAISLRDSSYQWAYTNCNPTPPALGVFPGQDVESYVMYTPGNALLLDVPNVAKMVIKYLDAAKGANTTVQFYASRVNLTQPNQPNPDNVYISNKSFDTMVAKLLAMQIAGNAKVNTQDVDAYRAIFSALADVGEMNSEYDHSTLVPEFVNLGPYDIKAITGKTSMSADASIFVCGNDTVEPGKLCSPDTSKPLPQEAYISEDCPKIILPAGITKIGGKADLDKIFDYIVDYKFSKTDQGGEREWTVSAVNIPKAGFCFKGIGTDEGQANMDETAFYNAIYHTNSPSAQLSETYLFDSAKEALNDGTGFCMGFNTFSRCRTNADCEFTANQWWGMKDEGGGVNNNFFGNLKGLNIFPDSKTDASDSVRTLYESRDVRLPTPYTPTGASDPQGIQQKYEMEKDGSPILTNLMLLENSPLTLAGFQNVVGHFDVAGNDGTERYVFMKYLNFVDNSSGLNSYIKQIYGFYRTLLDQDNPRLFYQYLPGTWNGWFGGGWKAKDFSSDEKYTYATYMLTMTADLLHESLVHVLTRAYFQFPNQYAREFESTVQGAYEYNNSNPSIYQRRVTAAPFAVDFWHRLIGSLGYTARGALYHNDNDDSEGIYGMWGEDNAFDNNWDTLWSVVGYYNMDEFFYGNIAIEEAGKNYIVDQLLSNGIHNLQGPWPVNSKFFWERMFFTDLFPLLTKNVCYKSGVHNSPAQVHLLQTIDDWGDKSAAEKLELAPGGGFQWTVPHTELFDLCEYFGYGGSFRTNMIAWLNDKIDIMATGGNSGPSYGHIAINNIKFYDAKENNMRRDYFDQTAWGLVMKPDHSDFNLYPGVIPAAVYEADEKYNLYLPAHCEPPVNALDPTSKFAGFSAANNIPMSDVLGSQNHQKRKASDPTWLGPKINNTKEFGGTKIMVSHLFINPWKAVSGLSIDKYDPEHGMEFTTEDEAAVFQATVNLAGESLPISEKDFRGTLNNGQKAGAMRTAYICERTGEKVITETECNKALADKGWDFEKFEKMSFQELFNPGTKVGNGTSLVDLCNTPDRIEECTKDMAGTFLPPDYNEECSLDKAAPPDKDCNRCTHSPGFKPLLNKLLAYELGNPYSTNRSAGGGGIQHKRYPSATDVTSGLDTFDYMAKYSNTYGKAELIAPYRPMPPRTAAPDASKVGATANSKPLLYSEPFSVNNLPEGVVYLGSNQGVATLRFYAWAAHDQGPIRDITIDWGDGEVTRIQDAKIKNNKPICNTDMECSNVPGLACTGDGDCPVGGGSCMQTGRCEGSDQLCYKSIGQPDNCGGTYQCMTRVLFGNSPDDCRQGYFEFTHVYKTSAKTLKECGPVKRCKNEPDLIDGNCRDGEPGIERLAPREGCYDSAMKMIRFTPRIMVKDNWGWCTGDCSQKNEVNTDNYENNPNRYPVRHPNKGCWDGSKTRYNTDPSALISPFIDKITGFDECSEENIKGRPWLVFNGSVELSVTGSVAP